MTLYLILLSSLPLLPVIIQTMIICFQWYEFKQENINPMVEKNGK